MAGQDVAMLLPMFELVMFISAYLPHMVACLIVLATMIKRPFRLCVIFLPILVFAMLIALAIMESRWHAEAEGFDMSKPSLREALEDYIDKGKGDLETILEGKTYPPVFGKIELMRYLNTWLGKSVFHNTEQDAAYLPEAYNKGDDWFEATLSDPMVYTGALYEPGKNESVWSAQHKKLEFIAYALDVKEGDKALEIGCGWGRLSNHLAGKGARVTGVTMSSDQQAYARRMSESLGNSGKVDIVLKNFFDLQLPDKSFKVISSVEMAEHVGIRNYNKFLRKVHRVLADDGTFYLQVAGLPRGYATGYNHYEDLVWGLFMDEHVFPGADASCPMGWVVTHLEQAGFEVQSVHNMGYHYSQTLAHWLANWEASKDRIIKAYGERSWRRWRVFLAWSVRISRRGGSTVQWITATKSGQEKARIAAQNRLAPGLWKLPAYKS